MFKAFNMGIGYIIVADKRTAEKVKSTGETVYTIGRIVKGTGKVKLIH
jgi:phosphoribosylaminoimidazole (AIR) synthetase